LFLLHNQWCFEWPGKAVLTYFQAREAAESPEIHRHLNDLMNDLLQSGIRRVNFIGHSMGARVLVSYLHAHADQFNAPGKIQLGALLLPNPEADLKAFLDASSTIVSVAESVTIYAGSDAWILMTADKLWFLFTFACFCLAFRIYRQR